jgi:hypothetical protein
MKPYDDNKLKYPLIYQELLLIGKVWEFMESLRLTTLTRSEYRKKIITRIKQKYTVDDFFVYETIVEKMYWNLHNVIFPHISHSKIFKRIIDDYSPVKIKDKLLSRNVSDDSNVGESTVRKTYVLDKKLSEIIYKYKYPDDLDLILFSIMINRSLYETIMTNSDDISLNYLDELITEPYDNFIEFDYGYPNFNTIKPFTYSIKDRYNNINNMYYSNLYGYRWL